jgi:hypothetical protein
VVCRLKYATTCFTSSSNCNNIPDIPSLLASVWTSVRNFGLKFFKMGRVVKRCFRVHTASSCSWVHSHFTFFLNKFVSGLAIIAKPCIYFLKNPARPKNCRTCFAFCGLGILSTAMILLVPGRFRYFKAKIVDSRLEKATFGLFEG